jgi:hypothetical protein
MWNRKGEAGSKRSVGKAGLVGLNKVAVNLVRKLQLQIHSFNHYRWGGGGQARQGVLLEFQPAFIQCINISSKTPTNQSYLYMQSCNFAL